MWSYPRFDVLLEERENTQNARSTLQYLAHKVALFAYVGTWQPERGMSISSTCTLSVPLSAWPADVSSANDLGVE
eukprot:4501562-Amphidinium_carterae.1